MNEYQAFLERKRPVSQAHGFDVAEETLHPALFPFQRRITRWALKRGRAAVFADTGLGKTLIQLAWADRIHHETGGNVLILAPLAVTHQTAREAGKLGLVVTVCRRGEDVRPGLNVANYEMLEHFDPSAFAGLVADESSILKAYDGTMRQRITAFGAPIPFRLACTATPAPNDLLELVNHAEFLGIMSGREIAALFFTQDEGVTHKWRLKGHARRDFWRWMATWACAVRKPSDLGFADEGFLLPPLEVRQITVEGAAPPAGHLFTVEAQSIDEVRAAARASLPERVAACAELVNNSSEPWLVWCHLNDESSALARAIPDAVEVRGSDTIAHKEAAILDFIEGRARVLVSKSAICGFGLNLQHCNRIAFVGLSYSFEQTYQAIRRCWRFGQTRPVYCFMIASEADGHVAEVVRQKEKQAEEMMREIVGEMRELQLDVAEREEMVYREGEARGADWRLLLGDSVERLAEVETESVGLILYSPPFPGMYAYTNSARDMGNVRDIEEMIAQYRFVIGRDRLMRTLMPGRSCCVHLCQSVAFKHRDGYMGLKDFRGAVIQAMEEAGWIYYGEVCIEKNPQMKAVRTKDLGLLFKTLAKDSSHMHMALADYLLQFKKPGENPRPIRAGISAKYANPDGWITNEEWISWASPVWWRYTPDRPDGIRETDVLNVTQARETDDERHLCPLQIGVCERAVKLWSNPGELVLSPFAGIGSEGYAALRLNRRFVGIELKESYWRSACENLKRAERERAQPSLLALMEDEAEDSEAKETA